MPNRILKESICTSETIERLSWQEEAFFYRLITACDDFGRFDGRANVIRGRCFPLRLDRVTDTDVENWLQALQGAGLLRLYVADGHRYLQVVTWNKHQQIRAKTSKYPAMPEGDGNTTQPLAGDSICNQLPSDDSNGSHMSPYSYSVLENRESNISSVGGQAADEAPPDEAPKAGNRLEAIEQVMDCYNRTFSGLWARPLRLTPDRKAKIRARLGTYTVDEICQAIENIRASPFHCGENDSGKIYATPEFICRNDGMVDKWLNTKAPKSEDEPESVITNRDEYLAEVERRQAELEALMRARGET